MNFVLRGRTRRPKRPRSIHDLAAIRKRVVEADFANPRVSNFAQARPDDRPKIFLTPEGQIPQVSRRALEIDCDIDTPALAQS
jgi:hypothetical protein